MLSSSKDLIDLVNEPSVISTVFSALGIISFGHPLIAFLLGKSIY